jgi:tetratricopeptide (TPR) repeat protein
LNSSITAVALRSDRIAIGDINGTLNIYRTLPFPTIRKTPNPFPPRTLTLEEITAFAELSETLTGYRYDSTTRNLIPINPAQRLVSLEQCDFDAILRVFPDLDFSTICQRIREIQVRTVPPESMIPLWDRVARADTSKKSWPQLLELTKSLSATPWHQKLAASSTPRKKPNGLEQSFLEGNADAIMAAIQSAGNKGSKAAKALQLALASDHPEWIAACLEKAEDLPLFLRQLAFSRIAWLEGRRADALAVWPEVFPDLKEIRLDQDWDGWEQADFSSAYQDLRRGMGELLAELDLPADATAEQRKEVAERFDNPETFKAIGRTRFTKACLKAAFAFSAFKEEKETTFRLAARARELGEAPGPCLRAEAMALTSLGEYQNAHERWILLITEHPLATQKPGDYAEAAYTAFENSNPQQAMAILTTGLHRFPKDANFALRAGWVALLTGNADRAYRFLLSGRQIGFPKEKLENATALLAIAAAQSGATEDATAFYQDLIDLDPDWEDPATIDTLEWPEELKESLRDVSLGGNTL